MTTQVQQLTQLQGTIFAAQACSCSCDPCTCGDHCLCRGADAYIGPRWRFIGDSIESGTIDGVDLSHRILLNFAQTSSEKTNDWQEVILIDEGASPQQVDMLLKHFQKHQGSEVARPDHVPVSERAVYLVPMRYMIINRQAMLSELSVTCMHDRIRRVRGGGGPPDQVVLKEWTYNGHVAVQKQLGQ